MSNLWEFLLQTLTVSLTAGLLLLCKALFRDKLPPRWQYGIWLVLALRILLPVRLDQVVLFPLPLLVETTKTALELPLSSAFLTPWEPLSLHHVLPLYTTAPHSITDWLFCLYGAGVLFCLIWYLVGYIRFRLTLRHGRPISPTMAEAIDRVCEMYRLRACAAVVLPGLHTACICGGLRPVLVLPEDEWDDEHTHMVLLHELLHLRYRDGLASIFWCVLRCLHWCNPFLWWVFRQIEGDMEALCDSRVMERLEGEDRRTYGRILLSMATKRYSNTPGTSSIANGTKTIARRIETIARFTRYPKGTETAALCIAVLLAFPVLAGTTAVYDAEDFTPDTPYQLQRSLAMTRLHRCSTMAGAIDTWAKGMLYQNGIALATVSPLSAQEDYAILLSADTERRPNTYLARDALYTMPTDETWILLEDTYQLFNLLEIEDGIYTATVAFSLQVSTDTGDNAIGLPDKGSLCIPVQVENDGDGWIVTEIGERLVSGCDYDQLPYPGSPIAPIRSYSATGTSGTVECSEHVTYTIVKDDNNDTLFDPDATFRYGVIHPHVTYTPTDGATSAVRYGFRITTLFSPDVIDTLPPQGYQTDLEALESHKEYALADFSGGGGGSNQGTGWAWERVITGEKLRSVYWGSGDYQYDLTGPVMLPYGYAVQICWGTDVVETYTFTDTVTIRRTEEET